jgi:hypothetical protein
MSILKHLQAPLNASMSDLNSPDLIRSLDRPRRYINSTAVDKLHYATVPKRLMMQLTDNWTKSVLWRGSGVWIE